VAWPAQASYRRRESGWARLSAAVVALGRMVVPVLLLVSALAACYTYLDTKLVLLADTSGRWLTLGHLILPSTFFAVALTNRRYGPSYAFAQVVLALAVCAAAIVFAADSLRGLIPAHAEPSMRVATSFAVAFFLASFVSILLFDAARGPRWWTAPLLGLAAPALVFSSLFFPMAYAGAAAAGTGDRLWFAHMLGYLCVMTAAAIVSLIPFWALRAIVPPLSGFGGY